MQYVLGNDVFVFMNVHGFLILKHHFLVFTYDFLVFLRHFLVFIIGHIYKY